MFNGHCYYTSSDSSATYDVARAQCQEVNTKAELASVHDMVENTRLAGEQVTSQAFIGLQNYGGDQWVWADGGHLDFNNWEDGQPAENKTCAVMKSNGKWAAVGCGSKKGYHCKLSVSAYLACPLGWQLYSGYCYLNQDELLSWEDARSGCVAKGGDLVSVEDAGEQAEVMALMHSGPECPAQFSLIGDTCYLKIKDTKLNWKDAKAKCQETDAYLALVKTGLINDAVQSMVMGGEDAWIGLTDKQTEGTWKWADGKKLGNWNHWKEGSPNGGEEENCAVMSDAGTWDDKNCTMLNNVICTKPKGNQQMDRWIGMSDKGHRNSFMWTDDNPVTYTNWGLGFPNTHGGSDSVCVYMDSINGGWLHSACHENMPSVCKTAQEITSVPPDHYGCDADQVAYEGSCYQVILSYKTWDEAQADCILRRADLVTITSEAEQARITTIIAETDTHFSLGMRFDPDSQEFQWVSGEEWTYEHWAWGEPDMIHHDGNNTDGWCAYMHRHDEIGFWRVVSCDEKFAYICESPRQGYTEPPTTTTTVPPVLQCPSLYAQQYNGHCYEWFSLAESQYGIGWSFEEGRAFCKNHFSGDLISFGDKDEEDWFFNTFGSFFGGGADSDWWIGMKEDNEEGYHWVDGTQSGYENWGEDYPNSEDGKLPCVASHYHYNYDTYESEHWWENANCETRVTIFCEVEGQVDDFTTAPPPTRPPNVPCHDDGDFTWIRRSLEAEDFCYAFMSSSETSDYVGVTWAQAHNNCTGMGGELVSVHSLEENKFIHNELVYRYETNAWIGFNRLNTVDGHEWSDNSTVDFAHWAYGEPNDAEGSESCTSIYTSSGEWNDEQCGNRHGFVCKKPRDGTWTTQATTPFPSGHCPQDWLEFEGRCYKLFGLLDIDKTDWNNASAACRSLSITRMHNAELASVHSSIQQAFLVAMAAKYKFQHDDTMWIGLRDMQSASYFTWSDETDVDYTNWKGDEPNGWGAEPCVEMYVEGDHAGTWNDVG